MEFNPAIIKVEESPGTKAKNEKGVSYNMGEFVCKEIKGGQVVQRVPELNMGIPSSQLPSPIK